MRISAVVVGLGHMGRLHVKTIAANPAYHLLGVYDKNRTRSEEVAAQYKTRSFSSIEEVIAANPGLVAVASATGTHAQVAIPLLKAKIPVLTEKPIDDTLARAKLMGAAAKKAGVPLFVSFSEYFHPSVREVKSLLSEGAIGDVQKVELVRLRPQLEPGRYVGGNALADCLVHDAYNLLTWLNLPLKSVAGKVVEEKRGNPNVPFKDYAAGDVTIDGVGMRFEVSWTSQEKVRKTTLTGSKGSIAIDYLSNKLIVNGKEQTLDLGKKDNLTRVYDSLAGALSGKGAYPIDFNLALKSMEFCERLEKLGRPPKPL